MFKYLLPVPLLLASNPALACGGFFCNQDLPVLQTAERILFAIDEQAGTVTTHVTIAYEGPSEDFAWILPVAGVPELFTASEGLFEALALRTQPSYVLDEVYQGDCWEYDMLSSSAGSTLDSGVPESGVEVLDSKVVGPYETVTLAATSSDALLAWLNDNGFDLPADLDPKLAPYIAGGMNFVALKLAKDQDTGDIVPFGMTYPGDKASIPIQLTAIAAQPDMRLEVYIFGDARAVPETYLHVVPNDLAVDWFDQSVAYEDVVSLAANEAGGHAFATDFSGDTAPFRGTFYTEGQYDLDALAAATGAIEWMNLLIGQGFPPSAALVEVLQEHLPLPPELAAQGLAETDWWNCLECYSDYSGTLAFDAVAATATLDARIVQPMRDAEDLFAKYGHLSRLTSSLDAVEMTVDPVFTFNADMAQELSNAHVATVTYWCPTEMSAYDAVRTVAFPGGYVVELPSQAALDADGITEYEYMQSLTAINALVIESTGDAGEAAPVYDGRDDLQGLVDALNARTPGDPSDFAADADADGKSGCGCDATGSPVSGGLVLGLAALLLRRRRS